METLPGQKRDQEKLLEMEEAEITLTVNPGIEKKIVRDLNLEIESLQGDRKELKNGQIELTFKVAGEKAELMYKLVLSMIAKTNEINLN